MDVQKQEKSVIEATGPAYVPVVDLPKTQALSSQPPQKIYPVKKVLTLEAANTVVFRGPVTDDSVADAMLKITKMSRVLKKDDVIYLVLDTPGGSVFAGLSLIDLMKAIPQKIYTVTLFAASMGFQIVQNSDTRYILPNGTLMSHRAFGGLRGQFDGELESRYKMVKRAIDYMDVIAAQRMGATLKAYKAMIVNEYWVHGFDAVQEKAADLQVLVQCGASLDGTETVKVRTMFGTVNALFSKCPLIKTPLGLATNTTNAKYASYLKYLGNLMFNNKHEFIKTYVNKPKFNETFPSH